jgi:hypothetical protein
MRANETFELEIQPGNEVLGARMAIVLQREVRDALGRLRITPECTSLDEVEGQINMLQDELEQIRRQAKRVYASG